MLAECTTVLELVVDLDERIRLSVIPVVEEVPLGAGVASSGSSARRRPSASSAALRVICTHQWVGACGVRHEDRLRQALARAS